MNALFFPGQKDLDLPLLVEPMSRRVKKTHNRLLENTRYL
jgi:hypothetical protein